MLAKDRPFEGCPLIFPILKKLNAKKDFAHEKSIPASWQNRKLFSRKQEKQLPSAVPVRKLPAGEISSSLSFSPCRSLSNHVVNQPMHYRATASFSSATRARKGARVATYTDLRENMYERWLTSRTILLRSSSLTLSLHSDFDSTSSPNRSLFPDDSPVV